MPNVFPQKYLFWGIWINNNSLIFYFFLVKPLHRCLACLASRRDVNFDVFHFLSISFMICQPNCVLTGWLSWPFSRLNDACSNSFTIIPLPNHPKFPPRFLLGHKLFSSANFSKLSPACNFCRISFAFSSPLTRICAACACCAMLCLLCHCQKSQKILELQIFIAAFNNPEL